MGGLLVLGIAIFLLVLFASDLKADQRLLRVVKGKSIVLNYDENVAADFTGVFFDAYVDGVSLGTFDDGYTSDNAPAAPTRGVPVPSHRAACGTAPTSRQFPGGVCGHDPGPAAPCRTAIASP